MMIETGGGRGDEGIPEASTSRISWKRVLDARGLLFRIAAGWTIAMTSHPRVVADGLTLFRELWIAQERIRAARIDEAGHLLQSLGGTRKIAKPSELIQMGFRLTPR